MIFIKKFPEYCAYLFLIIIFQYSNNLFKKDFSLGYHQDITKNTSKGFPWVIFFVREKFSRISEEFYLTSNTRVKKTTINY